MSRHQNPCMSCNVRLHMDMDDADIAETIVDCGFEHSSEVQHECIQQAMLVTDILRLAKSGMERRQCLYLRVHSISTSRKTLSRFWSAATPESLHSRATGQLVLGLASLSFNYVSMHCTFIVVVSNASDCCYDGSSLRAISAQKLVHVDDPTRDNFHPPP